jgi:beta-glucosidase
MNSIPRSNLHSVLQSDFFTWATGIEDTFIHAPDVRTGRLLDEYELTDHYSRWSEDLDLMSTFGVDKARYGIPWYRVNTGPRLWDWSWAEKPFEKLLNLGIDPIVDLVHYGVPAWIPDAYLNPDFPQRMAEFAAGVAEKFRGRIYWYTPLNEPRIAAWYCGKLGWWPPYRRGWTNFLKILLQICRGIMETQKILQQIDPEIVAVHVDATDLYSTNVPELVPEVELRQRLVFLALDLITGRVAPDHPLWSWILQQGIPDSDLEWFQLNKVALDIVGINMYPMFTAKQFVKTSRGVRIRMVYGSRSMVEKLVEMYWERYRRPVMITEIASLGSVRRRIRWLQDSVEAVRLCRGRGIPLVGYTWWPMYGLIAWAYRQGKRPLDQYILQMGLWDLAPDLSRVETSLVNAYRMIINGGLGSVGQLNQIRQEMSAR